MNSQWDDCQIRLLLECLCIADDGNPDSIKEALQFFLNETDSWDLIEKIGNIFNDYEWDCCSEWNDIRPKKENE